MTVRPRELGNFKGVGHFEAQILVWRVTYVSRQYLWAVNHFKHSGVKCTSKRL